MNISFTLTKKGHPALWEEGGGMSNTGSSQVICGVHGEPKGAIYIRQRGSLACAEHALFIAEPGDWVVQVQHHRRDFAICIGQLSAEHLREVLRVAADDPERRAVTVSIPSLYEYSEGEWDKVPPKYLQQAVAAAITKSQHYHCREPHYEADVNIHIHPDDLEWVVQN